MNIKIIFNFLFYSILCVIFSGCHYHHDKLAVHNYSDREICYETLAKVKKGIYYQVSAGGKVGVNYSDSPLTRGTVEEAFDQENDGFLYIVFYEEKYQDFVFANINKIVDDSRFNVKKYSKSELDRINWNVEFTTFN